MLDTSTILQKIKKTVGVKTDLELSKLLNVKPNTISSWKKRNSLQYETIIELCEKYDVDLNQLFKDSPISSYTTDQSKGKVKMIGVDQHLEYFIDPEAVLQDAASYVFPTTEQVDMAFQVASESMYPTIRTSCYVLVKQMNLNQIQPHKIYLYVVDGKGIFLSRFKRLTEHNVLLFTNDNENMGINKVELQNIREIYEVKALFCPNLKHIGDL
ncbi:helix-turn-helix domain-containing protein [Myroides sp. LJL115]